MNIVWCWTPTVVGPATLVAMESPLLMWAPPAAPCRSRLAAPQHRRAGRRGAALRARAHPREPGAAARARVAPAAHGGGTARAVPGLRLHARDDLDGPRLALGAAGSRGGRRRRPRR